MDSNTINLAALSIYPAVSVQSFASTQSAIQNVSTFTIASTDNMVIDTEAFSQLSKIEVETVTFEDTKPKHEPVLFPTKNKATNALAVLGLVFKHAAAARRADSHKQTSKANTYGGRYGREDSRRSRSRSRSRSPDRDVLVRMRSRSPLIPRSTSLPTIQLIPPTPTKSPKAVRFSPRTPSPPRKSKYRSRSPLPAKLGRYGRDGRRALVGEGGDVEGVEIVNF